MPKNNGTARKIWRKSKADHNAANWAAWDKAASVIVGPHWNVVIPKTTCDRSIRP